MSTPVGEDEIRRRLGEIARREFHYSGPVADDMVLRETWIRDSMAQMTLLVEMENEFQVALTDEEVVSLVTVGDVVALLARVLRRPSV